MKQFLSWSWLTYSQFSEVQDFITLKPVRQYVFKYTVINKWTVQKRHNKKGDDDFTSPIHAKSLAFSLDQMLLPMQYDYYHERKC